MVDFPNTVAIPPTGEYAPRLMDFGVLGNLPQDYAQGQQNQFAEQQRQRQTQLQQPIDVSDPKTMALQLAGRDPGMAAQLLPFLLGQEPGQVSPLLGGQPGAPQAAPGGPSAPGAPSAPPQSVRAPSLPPPAPAAVSPRGDVGTGTVVDIVTGVLPENSPKTGAVIGNIAKAIGADPNAPLTPEQQARTAKLVQAYAQRTGIEPKSPPQPAPQATPAGTVGQGGPAPIPGLILPPQFKPGQEMEAAQALLQAGAQAIASNNPKTRAEGELMLNRAAEIEKRMAPKIVGGNLIGPRGEVVYSQMAGAADDIAGAIEKGEQPPFLTGLSRNIAPQVRQIMAKDGFNLAKAQQEWSGAQKQIQSLNGPQMTRYAGLAKSVVNTIDEVKSLAEEMGNIGIPLVNKAKLIAYTQAEGNSEKGQLAARYMAGINTLKEEFANLAQGGYAPTEAAWSLADQQINGNFGVKQLNASLDEVQRLINYRIRGIPNFSTLGPPSANRYFGKGAGAEGEGGTTTAAPASAPKVQTFSSPADVKAAITAGKLKSGDHFMDSEGNRRTVP